MTRTIRIKLYKYSELKPEAQAKAIEQVRELYYQYNDFAEQAVDDDYLFEPKHDELVKLFGNDFYEVMNKGQKYTDRPMIGNTGKKIYFNADRGQYLDCENAMIINNEDYFLRWLGIPAEMEVSYDITTPSGRDRSTVIEIQSTAEKVTPEMEAIIEAAEQKFSNHVSDCLHSISESIDYYFSDTAIIEDMEANDYEFTKDGTKY